MRTLRICFCLALVASLSFYSCSKDDKTLPTDNAVVNIAQVRQDVQKTMQEVEAIQGIRSLETRSVAQFIVVPANSTNALAQAIQNAGEGGIVYLRTGLHTETARLRINQRVVLIGEDGAILKIKTMPKPVNANGTQSLEVAIHVANAPRTLIQNIDIQPIDANGGAAILLENATESAVMNCTISKQQHGILVEKSDRLTLMRNKITITSLWQTGEIADAHGIVIINGTSAYVADNTISNALFGVWACDKYGTFERNTTTRNYIGLILCNVPASSYVLPSGTLTGSATPATLWKTRNNTSTDNLTAGYLVIDGANNNILEGNQAARNGTYDIELTGDSYRFGFLTPRSFNNRVVVQGNQKVKNCGVNNTVIGGNLVNNSIDPCN